MSTEPVRLSPLGELAKAISDMALCDHTADITDVYEKIQPFLDTESFKALGAMLELCPLHHCDIRICADDGIHGDEVYDTSHS